MRARLLLLAGALAAFGGSLGSGFHFDDYAIFSDPVLRSSSGLLHLLNPRQTRPLTYLTFWLNYQAGGQTGFGYHAVNLLLHLAAAMLAYECLRRLLPERTAWMAAALFAIHPIQAEAVNYVWARSILLAALFCFAALLAWIQDHPFAAVAWFAAALLAKEECAAFPLFLAMMVWGRALPRPRRSGTAALATMFALATAAGARVIYATAVVPGAPAGPQAGISPWNYLLAQSVVILRYLRLLIVPYGFTVDPDVRVPMWLGLMAWAAMLGLVFYLWRARDAGREAYATWFACIKWFIGGLILLIPSSSIFPAADLSADRRMYLPMLAFAAAGALLLAGAPLERVKTAWTRAALATALLALSFQRTLVWTREESLWREAVERAPDKVRPKIQLARAVPAAKALELLSDARRLAPLNPAVAAETGRILLSEGQPEAALQEFGRALALDPSDARNLNNRGVALQALWQTEAARQDFQRALEIDPNLTEARENLGKLSPPAR